VLFFTTSGRAYKIKVWRLPLATPQSRGKAIVNLLPNMQPGEGISAILPLPEDESSWADLTVMFATSKGNVRRNSLGDFANVMANGKIAMKFEDEDADDTLIGVSSCSDQQDVLLATRNGKCIRFPVTDVRVFTGRSSVGVRGIRLLGDDKVISMSILNHVEIDIAERDAYLSLAGKRRRQNGGDSDEVVETSTTEAADEGEVSPGAEVVEIDEARFTELDALEEFLLSVTSKGFGVRTSAFRFRITGRGGQGVDNMNLGRRGDAVISVFPVQQRDEIVLVTDQGQVIRCPVHDIRIAARGTAGVVVFRVSAEEERVVSVATLRDTGEASEGDDEDGPETPVEGGGVPPDSTVH
jgi:DNA gyrase subunit A